MALAAIATNGQNIQGYVIDESSGKVVPVQAAVVAVAGTGSSTTTDDKGFFKLENVSAQNAELIVTAFGFKTDTIALKGTAIITITLQPLQLKEVEVKASRQTFDAANVEAITEADLVKDACCNLSESFENSATVDVSYSDAVSGAKELRMLGLDGVYTQIMIENVPAIRSLGNTFGLNYLSGPWMSSIQVNKGAGSVVNGYESMTGQINVELKKPANQPRLFINYFMNQDVRNELNVITAHTFKKGWSYLGAVHGFFNWLKMDMNHDHYIDNALATNINVFQRMQYTMPKGGMVMLGVIANIENRRGGSVHFNPQQNWREQANWGLQLRTNRAEVFAKTGFSVSPSNYVGIQYKYIYHEQRGHIGRRDYNGAEHFGYFNTIFQHDFTEGNLLKTGLSFQTNYVTERFDTIVRQRMEIVPGTFAEASLNFGSGEKVSVVAGGRVDYHNLYGVFASPRINMRWNILYDLSLRLSGGRGYRVPTIFAENFGWLANNRKVEVQPDLGYEEAWNYGASLSYRFNLNFRDGYITADYYRTDFSRQVVADLEDVRTLRFYNLDGRSFANAFQIETGYEPVKRFEVKLAYKYEINKVDYREGRKIYPLRPLHRGLLSLQYSTKKENWRFNSSLNWFGKTRVPDTSVNDEGNQRPAISKDWLQWNAQVTFRHKKWEVYLGAENILNFIQQQPIIAGDSPLSNQFDASLIWGPLRGAMAYAGFRWVME